MVLGIIALYPYRKIFQECGTAIPLNGGVYVAMLNSSSKFSATFAASCSLISYRSRKNEIPQILDIFYPLIIT
jgi:amino acid transporter